MRIVLQTVQSAEVTIGGTSVGRIGRGFLLFVGFTEGDTPELAAKMADKVVGLRVFPDEGGLTNKALKDIGGAVLSVSQFTLYGDVKGGRRPSFVNALRPQASQPLYDAFNAALRQILGTLETGVFGADMAVSLVNDGPFTLVLDSEVLYG